MKIPKLFNDIKNIFCKNCEKEPWQITAARYCVENSERSFTKQELEKYIKSLYNVNDWQLNQFFEEEIYLPTGRKFTRTHNQQNWIPPLELVSKITDYDELKEARKNARQAFWLAIIAIIISAIALIVR